MRRPDLRHISIICVVIFPLILNYACDNRTGTQSLLFVILYLLQYVSSSPVLISIQLSWSGSAVTKEWQLQLSDRTMTHWETDSVRSKGTLTARKWWWYPKQYSGKRKKREVRTDVLTNLDSGSLFLQRFLFSFLLAYVFKYDWSVPNLDISR